MWLSLRFQRGFDRHRLHGAEKLSGNRGVDTGPPKVQHLIGAIATIE
jgi:hypothetical protein